MIREPIVSGQFYPKKHEDISKLIEGFKVAAASKISAKGIILPHAGYAYSGKVAAAAVNSITVKKRLIILGPNHTGLGPNFSLWARGAWKVPSGEVEIDENLAGLILSKGNSIEEDYLAHKSEHSIEVELPILQHFFGGFKFVPITCRISTLEMYRKVSSQLAEASKSIKDEILFVASTDLTHYETEEAARLKDRKVIEAIVDLDEEDLMKKINKLNISMCGEAPVVILISCLKKLGARKSQVVLYQTSGDTSGDFTSVVGYVGMVIK